MTLSITHTAGKLAQQFQRYAAAWSRGVAEGLRDIAIAVERQAVRNTSGSGAPGSYPVPIRIGKLRGSIQSRFGQRESMVIATAVYSSAIHNGFTPYGARNARKSYTARPFLQDAADSVDAQEIMLIRLDKALPR